MSRTSSKVDDLRREFDAAFAAPYAAPAARVDLVALRAGTLACAVRTAEVEGVAPFRGVAPVPCGEPAFLGVAGVRGAIVPVYDLAALAGGGAARAPRWLLLSGGAEPVALAFDEMEGYLRVGRDDLVAAAVGAAAAEAVRAGASLRPVVSLASVLKDLRRRLGVADKER